MSIDIEQRGGITHHNDTPNPALPNDKMIYEVKDFMSYFLEMDVSILLIQHTYAYLKHHNNFNNGRDVSHYDVGWWIKRNCPSELKSIVIPDEVVKKGIYSDEKLRISVGELFSNLWEHNITTTLRDAYLAVSAVGVEGYACEDLIRTAIEHGDCMRTAWLILNNKTLPLDPNSQDVIDLCNNMHKHVSHDTFCIWYRILCFLFTNNPTQTYPHYLLGCIIICSNECQPLGMGG